MRKGHILRAVDPEHNHRVIVPVECQFHTTWHVRDRTGMVAKTCVPVDRVRELSIPPPDTPTSELVEYGVPHMFYVPKDHAVECRDPVTDTETLCPRKGSAIGRKQVDRIRAFGQIVAIGARKYDFIIV